MVFLGWFDPDPQLPTVTKVGEALARYNRKFARAAQTVLTNPTEATALGPESHGLVVRGVSYIPRHTFYIGVEDAPQEQ